MSLMEGPGKLASGFSPIDWPDYLVCRFHLSWHYFVTSFGCDLRFSQNCCKISSGGSGYIQRFSIYLNTSVRHAISSTMLTKQSNTYSLSLRWPLMARVKIPRSDSIFRNGRWDTSGRNVAMVIAKFSSCVLLPGNARKDCSYCAN